MSKETKLGLLISLGVILAFAMIISIRLGREEHADLGQVADGGHLEQYNHITRTTGVDAIDRDVAATDSSRRTTEHADGGSPAPAGTRDVAATGDARSGDDEEDTRVVMSLGPQGFSTDAPPTELRTPDGVSPVGPPDEHVAPAPSMRTYKVKAGDRLYAIAEAFYGAGKGYKWTRIRDANPGVNPDCLRLGETLKIPPLEDAPVRVAVADAPAGETPAPGAATTTKKHTVAPGETLGHISTLYYGTCRKWQLIADANPGIDPRSLRVGSALTIPASGGPAAVRVAEETESREAVDRALDEVRRFTGVEGGQPAAPPHSTYTVARGDTLWSISDRQFGDSHRWKEIYDLNRDQLASPEAVRVGQVIRIPAVTTTAMSDRSGVH